MVTALATALGLGGCIPPLEPYTTDIPPLVLAPAAEAGIEDARGRFREILCAVAEARGTAMPDWRPCAAMLHRLRGEPTPSGRPVDLGPPRLRLRVLAVPGFGADCFAGLVRPFEDSFAHLERLGWRAQILPLGNLAGSRWTAERLRDIVLAQDLAPDERIVLLGYSKGAADSLELLARWPDAARRVAALLTVAGSVNGSPLAEKAPEALVRLGTTIPGSRCDLGDGEALDELRRPYRWRWRSERRLFSNVPIFGLVTFVDRPSVSQILLPSWDALRTVDPRNDGQMIFYDQLAPGSTLLGYVNADHLAVAMPIAREHPWLATGRADQNAYPREILYEAALRFIEERLLASGSGNPAGSRITRREAAGIGDTRGVGRAAPHGPGRARTPTEM